MLEAGCEQQCCACGILGIVSGAENSPFRDTFLPPMQMEAKDQPERCVRFRIRKGVLATGWRGTRKELGMTVPHDYQHRWHWHGCPNLYQNNYGRCRCNRSRRVHHNAQGTMVCIAAERVHVRYLNYRQQRKQGQAHQGNRPESRCLRATITPKICLKRCQ